MPPRIPRCSICDGLLQPWYPGATGYGHNAEPINHGRCCNGCNDTVVIPARIALIVRGQNPRAVPVRGETKDHESQ